MPYSRVSSARATIPTRNKYRATRLAELYPLVLAGCYRIAPHAWQHARCEGFTEDDMVNAVLEGQELARYPEDGRVLVLGYISVSDEVKLPLHVVLEMAAQRSVDVVTAYIPHEPHRIISRRRLAELLRHDRHQAMRKLSGPKAPTTYSRGNAKTRRGSSQYAGRWHISE